jgi:hypothetical protein
MSYRKFSMTVEGIVPDSIKDEDLCAAIQDIVLTKCYMVSIEVNSGFSIYDLKEDAKCQ